MGRTWFSPKPAHATVYEFDSATASGINNVPQTMNDVPQKLRASTLLGLLMCLWGCSESLKIPPTDPVVIGIRSEQIYQTALSVLRPMLSPNTKIMREDSESGIIFRFSAKPGDSKTIRLVEVAVKAEGTDSSRITVHCEKFSLMRNARREDTDAEMERKIISLLEQD